MCPPETPIDVMLYCPACGHQHVDAPEPEHLLYTDGDKDKPASILDANGDVALGLCKRCGKGEAELAEPCWTNPPHRSHLCHNCGVVWRPADVPTNGVLRAKTRGEKDSYPPVSATQR